MAIDTENKRRNVSRITTLFLIGGLAPTNGVDTDDRENSARAYIGFEYEEAPVSAAVFSRIHQGVSLAF